MSENKLHIHPILPEDLLSESRRKVILQGDMELYWTLDWSPEFYMQLAKLGFISTAVYLDQYQTKIPLLLPEIQSAYSVLHWNKLHISRSMQRWMRSSTFEKQGFVLNTHHNLKEVMNGIQKGHGSNSWLIQPYQDLLSEILFRSDTNFKLQPVALLNKDGELIAGEIGYRIGKVYTSLTGFMERSNPDHNHAGKLQIYLLAKHLQEEGIQFWNLGHPGMQYKLDLGAEILPRNQFLSLWEKHVID